MLIVIPNKCLNCKRDIPHERVYGEGLIQMTCDVHGFEPFKVEGCLSWCSLNCFLEWYFQNIDVLNVTMKFNDGKEVK